MGRNRRQERLRDRRERKPEANTPTPSGGGSRSGGSLSGGGKPAWRETIDAWGGFTVIGAIGAAVVIGALLIFINRPGASANDAEFVAREYTAPVDRTVIGDPNAPVRIIEYGDYQCPHCKTFFETIEPTLMEEYVETGLATFEFRDYAFLGAESRAAAEAAACAADQNRFWDFHAILFLRQGTQNTGVFSDSNLRKYANTLANHFDDFDAGAWQQCYSNKTHEAAIIEANRLATNSGVSSTPTTLINGQAIPGTQNIDVYRKAIEDALPASSN